MRKETITKFEVGERLDKALAASYPQYSRSALEKLIDSGSVTVNGDTVKTKYKLKAGDEIEADLAVFNQSPPKIDLPIIYEDDDVVVINKPAGLLTHAKGTLHNEATVATWLKTYCARMNPATGMILAKQVFWESNRAGIVHRLDRGTSGVMICTKNEAAQIHLQKQFADRRVKKTYVAVVSGSLPEKSGLIDIPIERNPKKPATFRAGVNGKSAQTDFAVLKTDDTHSLVELKPYTGRTHQLRVHLAHLKHPIVGDDQYDGEPAERLMLHAKELEITLPSNERKVFTADVPEDIASMLG
ncbi:RluA family pseudouridine synthase [Candidatus Saccharibacteria bacterium]|nr:RluA family pseudouridine synthase [Candidatus Saccharibacteria bacterium]